MSRVRMTMLSSMAARDYLEALDRHVNWGLMDLDLRDGIFGKGILDLTDDEARRAAEAAATRGLSVYCLSTSLLARVVEEGRTAFREHLPKLERAIRIGGLLRAKSVRLIAARTVRRDALADAVVYARAEHPWLFEVYREFVDRLHGAGLAACIENEVNGNILSTPAEVLEFFEALDRPGKAHFTWDIVNLWQEGTFPTLPVYRQLKPVIGYIHLKGGRADVPGGALRWSSALEDASWPAAEVLRQIAIDGASPLICLNPPHGVWKDGSEARNVTERDLKFSQAVLSESER